MSHGNFESFYKKFYDNPEDLERKRARLFPAFDKKKVLDEDVTSNIFLGCLVGIKEFYEIFFNEINIKLKSNSQIHAYTQIDFDDKYKDDKIGIPDGMIVITEGKYDPIVTWVALLEFKTAQNLEKEQINRYVSIAKDPKYNFDAIITVSNDLVTTPLHNPFRLKDKKISLYHYSWIRIQTLLNHVIQKGVIDEDQDYLARQFLLYLKEHKDVINFNIMNSKWSDQSTRIRDAITLSKTQDKSTIELVAIDWMQEEQDLALQLQAETQKNIIVKLTKEEQNDINERIKIIENRIYSDREIKTSYYFEPNKSNKSPFKISKKKILEITNRIDFKRRKQLISLEIDNTNIVGKRVTTQVESFVKYFIETKPAKMDTIKLKIFLSGKQNPILEKTLSDYIYDYDHGNILKGCENINSTQIIRKLELEYCRDFGSNFSSRKLFISILEETFKDFFIQIVKPFAM